MTEVHWVKPFDADAIWAKQDIFLQPSDLIPNWMDYVWVFPGPLHVQKLCDALAKTLQEFYHVVGRLKFSEKTKRWSITFSENKGIPLTVGTTTLPSIIAPDFNHEVKHPDYVDEHPDVFIMDTKHQAERPLITLKVVNGVSTQETTITLGWCHVCGDCTSTIHMMNSLSLYYLDIQPTFKPTFDKYHEPDPTLDKALIPEVMPILYVQEHALDISTVLDRLGRMVSATSRVSVHISVDQVQLIHAWVTKYSKVLGVTETDAIIGFMSTCIAAVSPVPVEKVAYIIGTRGVRLVPKSGFISPSLTTMGNCMQTIATEQVPENATPSMFADAMRTSMNLVRDPENLRRILALHSQLLQRPGLVPDYLNLSSPDTMIYINALNKTSVLKAHFGYPNCVRFYLYGSAEHFVSMLPANPTCRGEGWVPNTGGIDIVFRLKHNRVENFWKIFNRMIEEIDSGDRQ